MSAKNNNTDKLLERAAQLARVFRYESHNTPKQETENLEKLEQALKRARLAFNGLSPANKVRVLGYDAESLALDKLISDTQAALSKPLPKKSKSENLYQTLAFDYELITGEKPTIGRLETPSDFQQFMAVTLALIDGNEEHNWEQYTASASKAFQRLGQKPKI